MFLNTNNELLKEKLRKLNSCMKRVKYLGINLTKKVKGLYTENWQALMKIEENMNRWKNIL